MSTKYDLSKGGIYNIICMASDKHYIGSAKILRVRFNAHRRELRAGDHGNRHLQNAWNKYGEAAFLFEVVEYVENPTRERLEEVEQLYLDAHFGNENFYNMKRTATSGAGVKLSEESLMSFQEKMNTPEVKASMSAGQKKRFQREDGKADILKATKAAHTPEALAKTQKALIQYRESDEGKLNAEKAILAMRTPEAKEKQAKGRKRFCESEEGREQTKKRIAASKSPDALAKMAASRRKIKGDDIEKVRTRLSKGETLTSIAQSYHVERIVIRSIRDHKHGY